ncbi:hypothetical protein MM300_07730 [Evansella sp. LMS18]|uniref:hypothetical protein n=1 Tax=Evansella sp. LMS18 TaxID=2924033 RepID=UPI0020D1A311|nr:hypothetical protein [Evansella sp. LMS18]UTR12170.1 hypothetical protein MM300_07730 [Evansella sp. LMS18]
MKKKPLLTFASAAMALSILGACQGQDGFEDNGNVNNADNGQPTQSGDTGDGGAGTGDNTDDAEITEDDAGIDVTEENNEDTDVDLGTDNDNNG